MFRSSCTASRGSRLLRGVIAVFVAAFALASLQTPIVAVFAGVTALYVAFLAVTGWCPGS